MLDMYSTAATKLCNIIQALKGPMKKCLGGCAPALLDLFRHWLAVPFQGSVHLFPMVSPPTSATHCVMLRGAFG